MQTIINDTVKIEIRKFKYFPSGSQETNCFTAEVWADGELIAYADNSGHGGPTNVCPAQGMRQKYNDIEAYLTSLPPVPYKSEYYSGEMDSNLENTVDQLVDDAINAKEREKFQRKMETSMLKGYVIGKPGADSYATFSYKRPLADIIATAQGKEVIKAHLLAHVAKGDINSTDNQLLNTNLPADIMAAVKAALKA
jgi:hypothetical protein